MSTKKQSESKEKSQSKKENKKNEEVTVETPQPEKEVAPSVEEVAEAKSEVLEEKESEDISALVIPNVEVKEEDLSKYEPDTLDEFAVFAKSKEEKGKVWVKDHTLLKKVEGRDFTLSGTRYLGELKD